MSTAFRLPLWECNSPPNSPDSSEDFDLIAGRFSSGEKTSLYGVSEDTSQIPLDKGMPARRLSSASDCGSVSRVKFVDACRLNNNVSDSGDCDVEKCNAECASASSKRRRSGTVSSNGNRVGRSKRKRSSLNSTNERLTNVNSGPSGDFDAGTVGGDDDDEEDGHERSPRRQRELTPSAEINNCDVTESRDITSNPSIGSKACASDGRRGACGEGDAPRKGSCSAGSYSRRKHHKHHKHRRRTPTPEETTPVSPKVNPIFLWVRQDDTRIVEVMCEDYDHRNRIRLTRTHLGWRAIPKTERFAAAIIPKAPPAPETAASEDTKRARRKKSGKKKKLKKRKVPVQANESLNNVKECSVTLTRDDVDQCQKTEDSENHSECKVRSRSPSPEPAERKGPRLTKSFSCDFPPAPKPARNLTRSVSLDLNMDSEIRVEIEWDFKVQIESETVAESAPEVKTEVEEEPTKEEGAKKPPEEEKAPSEVIDISKQDPDFNDADCDELGELLKNIPDLEFVEEEELEQEDEEWSTPTDLTVPKANTEERECPKVKLPVLPPNISSLVTVTSTTRLPEPLTAPLPEVTITPIPNPKPAHQQKRQNNFLESLLSSPYPIKPEMDEITVTRSTVEKRPEKKKLPPAEDSRNKKMKVEDITLKSLLSKQSEKTVKGTELENHVKKIKSKHEGESADISKSRLHELLTEGASSSGSDPISQLKQVLSNPDLAVPDPLLVPRARLPALVASPASEIPRLLSMHLDKKVEEKRCPRLTDSDMLEVSLSNLRSLLSCNTDKTKSTDGDDLASYQKSLEAFLEWQRYQTDLLESQMKNAPLTPGLSPADIDLATATALNQMLWLPYLELNGNSVSPPVNSVFPQYPNGMSSLPHISTNHFPQSSPFLTPTSPMDIDAQMKTLAMWQEAVMSQNSHQSRKVPSTLLPQDRLKVSSAQQQKKQRPSPIPSPQKMRNYPPRQEVQKTHFNFDNHLQLQQLQQQQEALMRQQYELQRKQKRSNDLQRQEQHRQRQDQSVVQHMQMNFEDAEKNRAPISVKPFSNLLERNGRQGKKQSWQQFEQDLRKSAEMTNQMALRWHQFEDEMRKNQAKGNANANWQTGPGTEKPPEQKKETAKLKVKNLVDPNMSPPKLLKQIAPEEGSDDVVPIQDESQAHLWHPLFGR